jgi:hypothetical protein
MDGELAYLYLIAGIVGFISLRRHPLMASLPKAFQRTASRFVAFFASRLLS